MRTHSLKNTWIRSAWGVLALFLVGIPPVQAQEDEDVLKEIKLLRQALGKTAPPAATAVKKKKPNARTPSHVYQQTENIVAEIELLRRAMNITAAPRSPGVQVKKMPLHVYAKSLEVLEKIARLERDLGMEVVEVPQIPLKKIAPSDVFGATQNILAELRRLKTQKGIGEEITRARLVQGKTPSDVYENMWRASYMLDGLAGQIDPNYVFRNAQYVLSELRLIASEVDIALEQIAPAPLAGKGPKDVNIEAFKDLHKTVLLERKMKLSPLRVPTFPSGKITPSDVYDTTNMLMAELVRLKIQLGIETPRGQLPVPTGKKPSDALAQLQLIGANLDRLLARF